MSDYSVLIDTSKPMTEDDLVKHYCKSITESAEQMCSLINQNHQFVIDTFNYQNKLWC